MVDEISGSQVAEVFSSVATHVVEVSPVGVKPSSHSMVCVSESVKNIAEFSKSPFSGTLNMSHVGTKTKKYLNAFANQTNKLVYY